VQSVQLYIGLDVGDRYTHACVLDESGVVIEEQRLRTSRASIEEHFEGMRRARIVIEAGAHSPWMVALLARLGHEVILANPRRLPLITQSDSKNDRRDAQTLARLGRVDPELLSPIKPRSEACRADLAMIRARDELVRLRTALVNHARGAVKPFGVRLAACSAASFPKKVREALPSELREALTPILDTLAGLSSRIQAFDKTLAALAARHPGACALTQVNGVGTLTALTFVLTIGDPERFKSSRTVGAYFGLRPRQRDSGQQEPELHITKAGAPLMRRLLVNCAQYILGPFGQDCDLRRFGLAMVARGGKSAKKRAVVAVARKLAVLLHRLWVTGEVYDPLRNAKARTITKAEPA
jgi:transposase